jgi:hypothetical protein
LRGFYSKIIQIKRVPNIDEKYNKLQALTLIDYKKVIVIDIDTIVLKYPDYLFTLDTPAVYMNDGLGLGSGGVKGVDGVEGGEEGYEVKERWVYSGLYVLTPSISIYNKIMDKFTNKRGYKENINYIFTKVSKYNTTINSEFLGIKYSSNKDDLWKKSFMIQFVGDKPFLYKSKYSIEERVERDDNKLWFYYYSKIINKNFNLLQVKELEDVNNLSKYYLSELSRQIYTMTKVLQLNINTSVDGKFTSRLNKIFKTDKIKKNFVYYHIDSLKEYNCAYTSAPASTTPSTTTAPATTIPAPASTTIPAPASTTTPSTTTAPASTTTPVPPSTIPVPASTFITSGKHKLIMLIDSDKTKVDEEIRDVSLKIETRYDYKMKGYVIKNILVVLETDLTYTERMDIINKMYKDDDKYYYVSVIVIVYNDKLQIKNTDNIKVYEDVNNKMKLSSILNNNTLSMIENKKLDFFKKYSNILENLKFQSLKKWIYNNYSYNELQFLLITQPQTSDPCQNYDYIIIDSNNYSNDITIKNKVDLKLFFFDIIFTKSSLYKNKCNANINYNKDNAITNFNKDIIYCIDAINMVSY